MGFLSFEIGDGFESGVSAGVKEEMGRIEKRVPDALQYVGSTMISNLQKFIKSDWYDVWGAPKRYKRRTDNPSLGTPLGSEKNMAVSARGMSMSFVYSPSGEHKVGAWNIRSGDEIIDIIQTNKGWKYKPNEDKKGREIMPRPFWDNFVEAERDGLIMDAFCLGMEPDYTIVPNGNDLVFSHTDGALFQGSGMEDLPF